MWQTAVFAYVLVKSGGSHLQVSSLFARYTQIINVHVVLYPVSSHTCSFPVELPDVCSYSVHLCILCRLTPAVFLSGCLMFAVTLYTCVSHVVWHL